MNDTERSQWVDNDEGLYNLWRASRQGKRAWLRANRAMVDEAIGNVTEGRQPAHYLAYGKQEPEHDRPGGFSTDGCIPYRGEAAP
jgi:hypothetical protein